MPVKTFFILSKLRERQISSLPVSNELRSVLRKLHVRSLGDLGVITEKGLRTVSKNTRQLIAEIESLIAHALNSHSSPQPAPVAPTAKLPTLPAGIPEAAVAAAPPDAPAAPADQIFIPTSERGRPVNTFALSVRLGNALEHAGKIRLVGELHGLSFGDIGKWRNCGRKTVTELRELVRQLQSGSNEVFLFEQQSRQFNMSLLVVPPKACGLKLAELPLSVRLGNALQKSGYRTLDDLNGVGIGDLLKLNNCGRKSILELRELIYRAGKGEFSASAVGDIASSLREVASGIDAGLARLSKRNRRIFEARLFGNNGDPRRLEDVGSEFGMTRERVRQIVKTAFEKVRRGGGRRLGQALEAVARECELRVCPLTSELFTRWIGEQAPTLSHTSQFYVRVLDTLEQAIPAWPPGSTHEGADDPASELVANAIENWMRQRAVHPALAESYAHLRGQKDFRTLQVGTFLAALRRARKIIIDFPEPDQPRLRLRRLRLLDFARQVLTESPGPLTPEEIVERAKAQHGAEVIVISARGAANSLTPEQGFFLLGPCSIGLRQHFLTPVSRWSALCNQFAKLLHKEDRPVSTVEAVAQARIQGFEQTSSHEMAQIIREDKRFTDLGRHLFALTNWGVQEREHIKDLLPRVFADANQVLTVEQTLKRLTRLRSVSPYGLASHLQKHPEIRSFGFGYYGLMDWGDLQKEVIFRDRTTIERAVRRATPPVSFATLCNTFGVPVEGAQAILLWKTCAGSSMLRRAPEKQAPETLLLHKSVSLERSLATVARASQRPMPAYELQWELNAKFGEIFSHIDLSKIEERLQSSNSFMKNAAGEFMLDADADLEDFDLDALRAASIKLLTESRDIAACDELIERLELQGFGIDELSADMLASILRGVEGLHEVGHQRFRAR